ncbi:MAG: SOS response-associated peptidase [Candidatus Limnocylindrales bacterium]
MCGRFTQQRPTAELAEIFDAESLVESSEPRFNVAPTDGVVAVVHPPNDRRLLTSLRWGLIPAWADDARAGSRMINARSETIFSSPAYRASVRKRRCLIPADGFYEWRRVADGSKAPKQPYLIHRLDGGPLALAGIWSPWKQPETGEWLRSCAIVTTTPNPLMARLHDRMPVILAESAWERWLDPDLDDVAELRGLLGPSPSDELEAYPVSTLVNSVRNDSSDLTAPIVGEVLRS